MITKDLQIIAVKPLLAKSILTRLTGLITRNFSKNLDAMVFKNCSAIHSCFMRYEFDLIFISKTGKIINLYKKVKPWCFINGGKEASIAIELPSGTIEKNKLLIGDILKI